MLNPKTTRATRPDGTVFGSVIMKKRKMKISGEVMMIHQKWAPPIGVNDQRVVIVWPSAARMPMPTASGDPEGQAHGEQVQATADEQAAGEDHHVGGDHRRPDRRPPEVERLDPVAAEHQERGDQRDVRGVEHVPAAEADEVLRGQPGEGDGDEQGYAVERGVPALLGADHAEQQHRAGGGLERTRRPHQPTSATKEVCRLGDTTGDDRDHDLRDRQLETQPHGADGDDREDRQRQVDTRGRECSVRRPAHDASRSAASGYPEPRRAEPVRSIPPARQLRPPRTPLVLGVVRRATAASTRPEHHIRSRRAAPARAACPVGAAPTAVP